MVSEGGCEVIPARVAHHDKLLFYRQVPLQQFMAALEITLGALVKDEEVGAGVVAIVWHNEVCKAAVCDCVADIEFRVAEIWATFSFFKTLAAAPPAGGDLKSGEVKNGYHSLVEPEVFYLPGYAGTISPGPPAERNNAYFLHGIIPPFPASSSRVWNAPELLLVILSQPAAFPTPPA